ncbi:MAG: phosphotransferase family protein [Candidatus Hydrogenedentales bacterium]
MAELLDRTAPVRAGEELDLEKLEPYLRQELSVPNGPFEVEQFPGGHSNLTYFVRLGDLEMVLRRPPFGSKVKAAHDMGREYTILSHIHDRYAPAPRPLLLCEDESILGAKFYAMERIRGVILRARKPAGFEIDRDTVRGCCRTLMNNLADLHAVDWEAAGLGIMRKEGSFIERQVLGWEKRWDGSKTHDLPRVPAVFAWCKENMPPDVGAVLIHNDYKFDNIVLDPNDLTKIIGVLDWEMSTIGDPLFDLGVTLGYWIDPDERDLVSTSRCFLTDEPGSMSRKELAAIYGERTGRDITNLHWYYVFALIKLAVVLQQIYYRYHHGLTKDERFAGMITGVEALAEQSAAAIVRGSV